MPSRTKEANRAKAGESSPQPIRLVCVGDTHGHHRKLEVPPGEILIHSGDFLVDGSSLDELEDFNAWLGSLPFRHRIVVAGNHDRLFATHPQLARSRLTHATYLEDSGVTLDGLKFWGSPVNSVGGDWAFSVERMVKVEKHWNRIPDGTDVLVTHEAPYGTLDKPHLLAKHAGCQYLLGALLRVKPRLHVFGHIHGGHGREDAWGRVALVNCAVVDNARALAHPPTVVDLTL